MPFNLTMLDLTDPQLLAGVRQVKVLDSFVGATYDFHPEGLFSTEIFGRVGDERRELLFGHIDIKASIFHPLVYQSIVKLKRFYGDIMAGRKYAVWNEDLKDYMPATQAAGGRTGFSFFLEHWQKIAYVSTGSIQRDFAIKLVKDFASLALTSKVVVIPASYRDMEIDEFGRRTEHEINDLYRRLIGQSNVIIESSLKTNPEAVDRIRYDMQRIFCEIYDMIEDLVKGKKKLFLGKFASRRIAHGTRNVITAMNTAVSDLDAPGNPGFNSTIIGLYQYLQAALPLSVYHVTQFLKHVFPDVNSPARLVDPQTLRPKDLWLSSKQHDRWTTKEGIEKVISAFREESIRKVPLTIEGSYIGLIYEGPDSTFRFFQDIDELPADRDRKHVRPATLMDVLYLSVYKYSNNYPIYVTRYPILSVGSVYPSMVHLRTTVKFSRRYRLGDDWMRMPDSETAAEYPDITAALLNSLVPHTKHLKRLGADFDGDTSSGNILYTDEAIQEVKDYLKSKRAYVGSDGKLLYSAGVDTVDIVLWNMTGDPVPRVRPGVEEHQANNDDVVTYNEKQYSVNKLLELVSKEQAQDVSMSELEWMRESLGSLDKRRVASTIPGIPLIAIRDDDRVVVLDGKYRLAKLFEQGAQKVRIRFVEDNDINAALVE